MAFVLDVNLRIKDILGLGKVEAALSKLKGSAQLGGVGSSSPFAGLTGGGSGKAISNLKSQAAAATAVSVAMGKATASTSKMTVATTKAASVIPKTSSGLDKASRSAKGFGNSIQIAGVRYAAFLAATVIPFAVIGAFGKATAAVVEFDGAILKLRQITGETEKEIGGMRDTILDLAAATGTSASELAGVAKTLAQAGQRGDELAGSLSALAKVPLTPSFDTMNAAIEGTIAATQQFRKEGLATADVLDVLTALSNKFAASSEDIAKGISRGGAAFEAIGGTFKEFAAVFTTIRQATRESAETVGTFMKTISSRLADPKIVNFLEGKGIRIAEAIEAGDPVAAMKRIAAALENVSSIQDKIEIGTKLGGRRQISRLLALISNIDVLDEALITAGSSSGAFGEIAEEGLQGLQAQLNILIQEWNKLIQILAQPVFVPIIKAVTTLGSALAAVVNFASPVIPAFLAIAGFAAGFKLLAISITSASKALALMGTVGQTVGGGLSATYAAVGGGAAGASARSLAASKNAAFLTRTAVGAGTVASRLESGSRGVGATFSKSPMAQLGVLAGFTLAAKKASGAFQKAGNSAGVFASEAVSAASIVNIAAIALSGKGLGGLAKSFGKLGGPIAGVIVGLGAVAFAASKAAEIDFQAAIDKAVEGAARIEAKPIQGGEAGLKDALEQLGERSLEGLHAAAKEYENNWFDFFARATNRVKNIFTGQGNVTINTQEAQDIIDRIVGANPELLNEILKSSIEEFGIADLETGLEQNLVEKFGIDQAALIRASLIKSLGGLEKIADGSAASKNDIEVSKVANALSKATIDFNAIHVPITLTNQLVLLSDAVGKAAREINTNAVIFDKLSQNVGTNVGIAKPEFEFTTEAVKKILSRGGGQELLGADQLRELDKFTESASQIELGLEEFFKTLIDSKAKADDLVTALQDPTVDPFDIWGEYIDEFLARNPGKISPDAVGRFKAAAGALATELKGVLSEEGNLLPTEGRMSEMISGILGDNRIFSDAVVEQYRTWFNANLQAANSQIKAIEARTNVDVNTATRASTVVNTLFDNLERAGIDTGGRVDLDFTDFGAGQEMVSFISGGNEISRTMAKYAQVSEEYGELIRKNAEAAEIGTGASAELITSTVKTAQELANLQAALTKLEISAAQAPQALAKQQERLREVGAPINEEALQREAKQVERSSEIAVEQIRRQRQQIEIENAIKISNVFQKPADAFAAALTASALAVEGFTTALTSRDPAAGLSAPTARVSVEGVPFVQRAPVPEAGESAASKQVDKTRRQSALFGAEIPVVIEEIVAAAAAQLQSRARFQGPFGQPGEDLSIADELRGFSGGFSSLLDKIRESNLDTKKIGEDVFRALKEQIPVGAKATEFIGAQQGTEKGVSEAIQQLIAEPLKGLSRPEEFDLDTVLQQFLDKTSTRQIGGGFQEDVGPRDFSSSVDQIQEAARITNEAAAITRQASSDIGTAAIDVKAGGGQVYDSSIKFQEAVGQLQPVVDTQREALGATQQTTAGDGTDGEGIREAMAATTDAINALGERVDAITGAVNEQTQQGAEIAAEQREEPVGSETLENNTTAINANSEIAGQTQAGMTGLGEGMDKVASAMEEGIGIDVDTMSRVEVDVQGVSEAAKEFTSEFEAVATKVAKTEIHEILKKLAAASGNSEMAATFESVT